MFTGWKYRKTIEINSQAQLNNYQLKIELNSSNFDFSKAKPDGGDIRFADSDKTTELPYWIEKWDQGNQQAILWVKVPEIPSGVKNIYMYYGNPDATGVSNGDSTFDFFDDFKLQNIDNNKWDFNNAGIESGKCILYGGSSNKQAGIRTKKTFNDAIIIEAFIRRTGSEDLDPCIWFYNAPITGDYANPENVLAGLAFLITENPGGPGIYLDGNKISSLPNTYTNTNWNRLVFIPKSGNIYGKIGADETSATNTHAYSNQPISITINSGSNLNLEIDYIFIRKYASQEPTISIKEESVGTRFGWNTKLPGKGYKAYIYTSRMSRIKSNMSVRSIAKVYPAQDSTISIDTVPQVESDSSGNLSFYVDTNDYDLDQTFDVDIYKPNGEFYVSFKDINVYNIGTSINNINNYFETEENINKGDVVVILPSGKIKKYNKYDQVVGVDFEAAPDCHDIYMDRTAIVPIKSDKLVIGYCCRGDGYKYYLRTVKITGFDESPELGPRYYGYSYNNEGFSYLFKISESAIIHILLKEGDGIYLQLCWINDNDEIIFGDHKLITNNIATSGEVSSKFYAAQLDSHKYVISYWDTNSDGIIQVIEIDDNGNIQKQNNLNVGSNFAGPIGVVNSEYFFIHGRWESNGRTIALFRVNQSDLSISEIASGLTGTSYYPSCPPIVFSKDICVVLYDNKARRCRVVGSTIQFGPEITIQNGMHYATGIKTGENECIIYFAADDPQVAYSVALMSVKLIIESNGIINKGPITIVHRSGDPDWDVAWKPLSVKHGDIISVLYLMLYQGGVEYRLRMITSMVKTYPVIGISLEDATAGSNVKVATSGNADIFSDLKKGRIYYLNSDGSITLEKTDIKIGVSLDDKTIALQIQQ